MDSKMNADFWTDIESDTMFIESVKSIDVAKKVVFKYIFALKNASYFENVCDQLGKVKFICVNALLSEMDSLVRFDWLFKRNDPEIVNEILEVLHAIIALKDAKLC